MATIRAHFDGKVFIPDEPVNIPPHTPVRLVLTSDSDEPPLADLAKLAESLPDVPGWPVDGAAQVDHYLYGTTKHQA
jgi:hypothetical protein